MMSAVIALAILVVGCNETFETDIRRYLYLPEIVKDNLPRNLIPFLEAIELDGYEERKIRKMMIVGNTGKIITTI